MKIKRENIYKYIGIGIGILTVGIFSFFMLNKPNSNGNTCKIDNCETYRCEGNDCCECGVCSEGYSITNDYTCTKNNNNTPVKQDNPISVVENQSWETNYSTSMQTKGFKGATNGKGNITYSISTETNSNGVKVNYFSIPVKDKASIKMNSKTPVGTYVVVITVTATGNNEYGSKSKDITMTIKVKKQSSTTPTPTPTPTPSTVKVTGVSINKSEITVIVNKAVRLEAIVNPSDATNKEVTWTSSDTSVATVNSGAVIGVKAGTATITVTTKDGSKTATCKVTVKKEASSTIAVTGVSINKSDVSVLVNKKVTLKATVSPDNATNKNVTWKSSNTSIAKVSSSGVVTGVKAGTATITVTTKDGSKTATCKVTVTKKTIAVKSVSLDKTTLKIEAGMTGTIKATVDPSNATDAEVTWESSDKKIATVSDGVVTGVKAGTATITAKTSNGKKATCEVTVTKAATVKVTKVSLDKTKLSLAFGKGSTLTATVKPDNATNKEVTWASSNTKVVTVDKSGLVKGIKVGTAKVTVTTKDGSKKATCEVTVNKASNPITVTATQSWNANYLTSAQTKNFKEATKAQGKVTYAIHSQKDSSGSKVSYFSIPTNTKANIKMKAKTPKGTYTVSIYATAAGNDNYKSGTREIIMTVKVAAQKNKYEVKYYGASVIETDLSVLTLLGSKQTPEVRSSLLSLKTNTEYVVSFDYKTLGGTNKFNVDLYPDTLPEVKLTATTSTQHYDWKVSSAKADMKSCYLRFFDNQHESSEKDIKISNIMLGTVKTVEKSNGGTLGTLPTPTRKGYKFLGWYTKATGGSKVTKNTKVTSDMILYPHWSETSYVLAEEFKVDSNYTVSNSYSSSTLKFKTIVRKSSRNEHFALIWVKDAYKQLNNGNSNYTRQTKIGHFNREIDTMGYKNKGMIGSNGGFAIGGHDNLPVLATKGVYTRNPDYATWTGSDHKTAKYAALAVDENGLLIARGFNFDYLENQGVYTGSNTERLSEEGYKDFEKWLKDYKVRNNWAITSCIISGWSDGGTDDIRTTLCQVDNHNFVLATGNNSPERFAKDMHETFGCRTVVNLDGGGSTGMYYKTNTDNYIKTIYQYKRPSESTYRKNVDILYFAEQ